MIGLIAEPKIFLRFERLQSHGFPAVLSGHIPVGLLTERLKHVRHIGSVDDVIFATHTTNPVLVNSAKIASHESLIVSCHGFLLLFNRMGSSVNEPILISGIYLSILSLMGGPRYFWANSRLRRSVVVSSGLAPNVMVFSGQPVQLLSGVLFRQSMQRIAFITS